MQKIVHSFKFNVHFTLLNFYLNLNKNLEQIFFIEMAENDETSDKNLSTSENTKTCQQIESQNMSEGQIIHRYNREEMLKIRENALSRTRPKEFSKEFDK